MKIEKTIYQKWQGKLKKLQLVQSTVDTFYEKHSVKIIKAERQINGEKLRNLIKKHGDKIKIWCRNGEVSSEARPCNEINCKHKTQSSQVVSGCGKCGNFQITLNRGAWGCCPHITIDGRVINGDGSTIQRL